MTGSPGIAMRLRLALLCLLAANPAFADQPSECLSANPNDWPTAARPYFLIIADTSGSMTACTNPTSVYPTTCGAASTPNSCGLVPTRYNDLRCALDQLTTAYSGQARFGLSTFATFLSDCAAAACTPDCAATGGTCGSEVFGCTLNPVPGDVTGCGTGSGATRQGSILRVPIARDHLPAANQEPSNALDLLSWTDGYCGGGVELHAAGPTPLNGALRDAKRYFESGLTHPVTAVFDPSPLDASDRPCRSINVILITDGDETCDTQADAVAAAADLFTTGVTIGTHTYSIRTHVVNFAGGTQANTDAIAAAGGTYASLSADDEVTLSQSLSSIIAGGVTREICDNVDNDCNGCIDEGFEHFANVGQTCCPWTTSNERDACIASYEASVITSPPDGDLGLLPCTSALQQMDPSTWLCLDPSEICDGVDNDGDQEIDEGLVRCGEPLHCPQAETCNGQDDDCNGQIDDGAVCGACVPSPEICDGCDNDCDGVADNGSFPTTSCGLDEPANCGEVKSCAPAQLVASPGACVAGGGYGSCNVSPQAELLDGIDNDCNGAIDDGLPPVPCEDPGTPAGLVYGGSSQCRMGELYFGLSCMGFVGPTPDVTDGIDNDCDGAVDEPDAFPPLVPLLGPLALLALGGGLAAFGVRRSRQRPRRS